jgi:uncharacterized membrane protein YccC
MNRLIETATQWGFDASRLRFASRTAVACCVAVFAAWMLGLEHPQWSGMTVWIASQPMRGHLIEKSIFRVAGTVSGTLVGVALVALSNGQVLFLVVGLALWSGLCAGIGNVQRGFVSYGTILAGYSAAMVALLGSEHPQHIVALGVDRLATVLLGVAIALLVGWFVALRPSDELMTNGVRSLSGRVLRLTAARLRAGPVLPTEVEHSLLAEIAALDETLDPHGAGSWQSRQSARAIRALLSTHVSVLLWLKGTSTVVVNDDLASRLEQAAHALEIGGTAGQVRDILAPAMGYSGQQELVQALIDGFAAALPDQRKVSDNVPARTRLPHLVVLHRDWIGAREALIRAGGAMLLVGLVWWITGWHAASYMLLGTAVMITLFSTFENPARTMHAVIAGQVMGVAGALTCRWLAWPFATSEGQLIVLMMPFILLGAVVFSHRRTMASSFDYNMVMLLLLQPSYPLAGTWAQSLSLAVAVLFAPLFAFAAYRLIYPTNALRRMETLIGMMVHELQDMAAAPDALKHRNIWHARLYHRLLKLVLWVGKTGDRSVSAIDGGVTVLSLGSIIFRTQELLRQPSLAPCIRRRLHALLKRMSTIGQKPERALQAMRRTATLLSRNAPEEALLFDNASRHLANNLWFFARRQEVPEGMS